MSASQMCYECEINLHSFSLYVELMSLYTNKIGYNVSNLLPKQNQNLVQILT